MCSEPNHFNIQWNEHSEPGRLPHWYAEVFGYFVKVYRKYDRPSRFQASYEVAREVTILGGDDGYATADEAKGALDTWLTNEARAFLKLRN
jgi:hypothetical protein